MRSFLRTEEKILRNGKEATVFALSVRLLSFWAKEGVLKVALWMKPSYHGVYHGKYEVNECVGADVV
ncbi:hypothetical protein GCM10009425_23020 [Pseudomonas asuensis]|uniref:Uncharacterized protein n=1 Tax=Pseudomonas asuensis TaxID=1825787 RepID=A0ABQ2GSP8_9PSED|nr:hypothetical protein GCM10009425_23020 [Pseudomonas asuensis]